MSLLYYSRMRFIIQLLPLLLASLLPAHVVSVYAAGMEGKLFPEDLSLRDPKHYGFANCRSHVVYMKTLFMETLAERHRGRLSLVHVYPGLVITEAFDKVRLPTWVKLIWRWLVAPIIRPFSVPPRESGERILFLATPRFPARQKLETGTTAKGDKVTATEGDAGIAMGSDGNRGGGAYAVNWDGETISTEKAYKKVREEGLAGKVWDHTMRAFEEIEAGTVFTG
jgi:hypothetical protein